MAVDPRLSCCHRTPGSPPSQCSARRWWLALQEDLWGPQGEETLRLSLGQSVQARKEGKGSQECRCCRVSGRHSPGGNADALTRGPCGPHVGGLAGQGRTQGHRTGTFGN